ncbi:hypothetical protein PoB_001712800 [Plakobranchus ocellatus]|uniref:Fibronectin type-III domain-containing protein n=1 Tax=Plakobranchus ocellatus TaxID=259542 RepID=A0AAV3Z844_9GAST|nr:hypothetical protein PoB_001712800 [Plakobranchus ocellatus]
MDPQCESHLLHWCGPHRIKNIRDVIDFHSCFFMTVEALHNGTTYTLTALTALGTGFSDDDGNDDSNEPQKACQK